MNFIKKKMETQTDKFKFWCPIEKSKETIIDPLTGENVMRLGGIASTSDEDSDGEFLDPKGFDIKPLLESGMVNWHHGAKGQPATIIGEPTKAEIRPEGLYIETDLYPSSKIAHDVWELANVLEKDSKTRRLGYSIEGKVLKRGSKDEKSPKYKKILEAVITGVAVTHQPKNAQTFANIIKGEIDDGELTSLDYKAKTYKKENNCKTFSKAEIAEKLFKDISGISIKKADNIYLMLKKLANMKGRNLITEEDICKAYEALGLQREALADMQKGDCGCDRVDKLLKDGEVDEPKDEKKPKGKLNAKGETKEEEMEEEEMEESTEKAGIKKSELSTIEKAIAESNATQTSFIKALGVMIKDVAQKATSIMSENAELKEIIKGQDDTISIMSEKLEMFGSEVPAPKSINSARPIERVFAKSNENNFAENGIEKAKNNQVSISKNPNTVAELLDKVTFEKGYDSEFSKACTAFEANKNVPSSIIARIKNEYGIEIIK